MDTLHMARKHMAIKHMAHIMAKHKLRISLRLRVPSTIDDNIQIGNRVLVYREILRKWDGSYRVLDTDYKSIFIDFHGKTTNILIDSCKQYKISNDILDTLIDHDSPAETTLYN